MSEKPQMFSEEQMSALQETARWISRHPSGLEFKAFRRFVDLIPDQEQRLKVISHFGPDAA